MAPLRPALLRRRHAYTGENVPWRLDAPADASPLMRYLRGGGLRTFSSETSAEELRSRRQNRFLRLSILLLVAWIVLFFV